MLPFFLLLASAYLLTLFQTTVTAELLPHYLKPDFMLILVTYLGTTPYLFTGALLAAFCGLLYDTFAGSTFGLFLFIHLAIFFFIKVLAKVLILGEKLTFRMFLVALTATLQVVLLILLPHVFGTPGDFWLPRASWILPQILFTCAVCGPLFHLLQRLERWGAAVSPVV